MTEEETSKSTTEEETKEPEDSKEKSDEKSATIADVKHIVDSAIEKIKEVVIGTGKGDEKKEPETEDKSKPGLTGRTTRAIEEMAEKAVRDAAAVVFSEKEARDEEDRRKKKSETKEPEKPPVKKRWSTRIVLGNYGDE